MSVAYRVYPLSLAAGEERLLDATGVYCSVLGATDPNGVEIGFDQEATYFQPQGVTVLTDEAFKMVRVRNVSGAVNFVRIAVGYGDIRDSRLSTSAPVELAQAGGLSLLRGDVQEVDAEVAGQGALTRALLSSRTDKRAGLTDMTGAAYFAASGGVVVPVVAAVANVSGAVIRVLSLLSTNGSDAQIQMDGAALFYVTGLAGGGAGHFGAKDVFVPAGSAVSLVSGGAGARAECWIEVL